LRCICQFVYSLWFTQYLKVTGVIFYKISYTIKDYNMPGLTVYTVYEILFQPSDPKFVEIKHGGVGVF
jgi:hypothetical protein